MRIGAPCELSFIAFSVPMIKSSDFQLIPDYREWWRYGEAIATGFVESAVNQVVSERFVKNNR